MSRQNFDAMWEIVFFFFINLLILQLLVYNFNQSLRIGNHSGCMQRDMSNSPYCKNWQINVEM